MAREAPATIAKLLDLTGRVGVVTGGGTHLGRAVAETLGELGATVWLAGRRDDVLAEAAAELRALGMSSAHAVADVTDPASAEALVANVWAEHGRLDVMVCNAGGVVASRQIPDLDVGELEATMALNVTSAVVTAQAAARRMIGQGRGRIITLGSIHASLGVDGRVYGPRYARAGAAYSGAKGAVLSFTRALACELGEHGITVNCISPGQIPRAGTDPETVERFRLATPLRRTGKPEDLKGAVALLATDAGRWITGANVVVDGGWSAW